MDDKQMEKVVKELLRLPAQTARHREAISTIAARRRELAGQLSHEIGPTQASKRLGISRQTFWQILNPDKAQEIKRRSSRSKSRDDHVDLQS